jgi:hypothetical protein
MLIGIAYSSVPVVYSTDDEWIWVIGGLMERRNKEN